MQKFQDNVTRPINNVLQIFPGATCTIVNTSGGSSQMYSDNGVTPIASALSDSNGLISFYANDGTYTLTVTSGVGTVSRTIQLQDETTQGAALSKLVNNTQTNADRALSKIATYSVDGNGKVNGLVSPDGNLIDSMRYGNIATRCCVPSSHSAHVYANSRSRHVTFSKVSALRLVIPNFYLNTTNQETGGGSAATITASIEYPIGVLTQVKFSGNTSGTISNNSYIVSDLTSIAIPQGASFYVRLFYVNASGFNYSINATNSLSLAQVGEYCEFSSTVVTDKTMSGTLVNTGGNVSYRCCAILSETSKKSIFLVGDSRYFGAGDTISDINGFVGDVARSVGKYCAYSDNSINGVTLGQIVNSQSTFAIRLALSQYHSMVVCGLGINEITTGSESITTSYMTTFCGLFSIPVYWNTISPKTTSSDAWASLANQTLDANNTGRVNINNSIRNGQISGLSGYFEVADVVESSRDSGKWNAVTGGTALVAYTTDGTHANQAGSLQIMKSGNVYIPN